MRQQVNNLVLHILSGHLFGRESLSTQQAQATQGRKLSERRHVIWHLLYKQVVRLLHNPASRLVPLRGPRHHCVVQNQTIMSYGTTAAADATGTPHTTSSESAVQSGSEPRACALRERASAVRSQAPLPSDAGVAAKADVAPHRWRS